MIVTDEMVDAAAGYLKSFWWIPGEEAPDVARCSLQTVREGPRKRQAEGIALYLMESRAMIKQSAALKMAHGILDAAFKVEPTDTFTPEPAISQLRTVLLGRVDFAEDQLALARAHGRQSPFLEGYIFGLKEALNTLDEVIR